MHPVNTDHLAHPCSLIQSLQAALWIGKYVRFLQLNREDRTDCVIVPTDLRQKSPITVTHVVAYTFQLSLGHVAHQKCNYEQ